MIGLGSAVERHVEREREPISPMGSPHDSESILARSPEACTLSTSESIANIEVWS